MKRYLLSISFLLAAISPLAAGTKLSALDAVTNAVASDKLYVITNTGAVGSRSITLDWLLVSMKKLANWSTFANSLYLTNGIQGPVTTNAYAATVTLNVSNAWYQVVDLTGDITLVSTGRVSAKALSITAFLKADGSARTVTLNANWKVYGTNASAFSIPANKEAFVQLLSLGAAETDVRCAYDVAN